MSGFITEEQKRTVAQLLGSAFEANALPLNDLEEILKQSGEEHDHSEVFIKHGKSKGTEKQSYSSQSDGGFQTSKKENKNGSVIMSHMARSMTSLSELSASAINYTSEPTSLLRENKDGTIEAISNNYKVDLSRTQQQLREAAEMMCSPEYIEQQAYEAMMASNENIEWQLESGYEDRLASVPRNDDGTIMTLEQKQAIEATTPTCMAPVQEEYEKDLTDASDMKTFEEKLADPALRANLTAYDVPSAYIEKKREELKQSMRDESLEQRLEVHNRIAEEYGFEAKDGMTAYEVSQQSDAGIDAAIQSEIRGKVLDANDTFDREFDAAYDENMEQHANNILTEHLNRIEENGGVYVPTAAIDGEKLEQAKSIMAEFKENNPAPAAPTAEDTVATVSQSGDITPPDAENATPETNDSTPQAAISQSGDMGPTDTAPANDEETPAVTSTPAAPAQDALGM